MSIDTSTFEYQETRWQDLYSFLKGKGYDVYSPGQHKGECVSTYVVIKKSTSSKSLSFSSNEDLYDILIYVPKNKYSAVEATLGGLMEDMKDIYPLFKPYGQQTEAYFDDEVKGYMVSVMYSNFKKL